MPGATGTEGNQAVCVCPAGPSRPTPQATTVLNGHMFCVQGREVASCPSANTWFPPQKHLSVMGLVISQKYKPETGFSLGTTGSGLSLGAEQRIKLNTLNLPDHSWFLALATADVLREFARTRLLSPSLSVCRTLKVTVRTQFCFHSRSPDSSQCTHTRRRPGMVSRPPSTLLAPTLLSLT